MSSLSIIARGAKMNQLLDSVHPGDILREDYMVPFELSAYALSKAMDIPTSRVQDIIARRRGVSADTAIRLGLYFGTSAQFWLNLQSQYDIEQLQRNAGTKYAGVKRRDQAA